MKKNLLNFSKQMLSKDQMKKVKGGVGGSECLRDDCSYIMITCSDVYGNSFTGLANSWGDIETMGDLNGVDGETGSCCYH